MPNRTRSARLAPLLVGVLLGLAAAGCGRQPGPTAVAVTDGPTAAPTRPASPSPTTPAPEDVVRAFFAAYAAARATDDPIGLRDLVTSEEAPAYLTAKGFLEGQAAAGKASVVTEQRLEHVATAIDGAAATVTFDFIEAGYDIRREDASPLESPQVLPTSHVTVTLRLVDDRWLVDVFESAQ